MTKGWGRNSRAKVKALLGEFLPPTFAAFMAGHFRVHSLMGGQGQQSKFFGRDCWTGPPWVSCRSRECTTWRSRILNL